MTSRRITHLYAQLKLGRLGMFMGVAGRLFGPRSNNLISYNKIALHDYKLAGEVLIT